VESTILKVTGMSCGGCVKTVTKVLQELPGVNQAEVSLERNEAVVGYDSSKVTRQDMQRVIDAAGFDVI
jgi:copper chaperone